jgi:hypothetical protein
MGACSSKGGSGGQLLSNKKDLEDLNKTLKSKIIDDTEKSEAKTVSKQDIDIDTTIDPSFIPLMKPTLPTYNFLGFKTGYTSPYGCTYDISQTADIKIVSIKTFTSADTTNIWTEIKQKLQSEAKLQMTGNNKGLNAMNDAINDSEKEATNKIQEILDKQNSQSVEKDQKIKLNINSPAHCGPNGENPVLDQDVNVELLMNDLVTSTAQIVNKAIADKALSGSLDLSDSDWTCTFQLIGSVICSIIILYVIYFFVENSSGEGNGESDIAHQLAAVATDVATDV